MNTGSRIFSEGDYEAGTLTWGWECFDCGDEETGYGSATGAAMNMDYHACGETP